MFGTTFDVMGTRCTDGIWMGMSLIQGRMVVVLDCEGLFSIRRTTLEEVKLCTALAAVTDILILNQDSTFARQTNELMGKFVKAQNRLKGSNIFKRMLRVIVRDVDITLHYSDQNILNLHLEASWTIFIFPSIVIFRYALLLFNF